MHEVTKSVVEILIDNSGVKLMISDRNIDTDNRKVRLLQNKESMIYCSRKLETKGAGGNMH